ncbi:hypothetical protein CGCSCA1_v010671 [Colletotrichum siamense]|nr:hypothetical protein CGCSCA1_v010671 [Colletotrichum siamense]
MLPQKRFPAPQWRLTKATARSVSRFCCSVFAEWLVYALLFYATTAVVTLVVFLPIDCVIGLSREDFSSGHFVDFQHSAFLIPFNNFMFSAVSLSTRVLLIALWTITARPALALAGCIVRKRLPAYTHPSEQYPPIRWLFEIICSFANRHHKLVPDIELYARQILRMLGARVPSGSHQLGTITPGEHDELRTFARMYYEVVTQFSERRSKEPELSCLPFKLVEEAHYICALEVLRQEPVPSAGCSNKHTSFLCGTAQFASPKDTATTRTCLDWRYVRSEAKMFSVVYVAIILYWALRLSGDCCAFLLPRALDGNGVSSAEEWYGRHIAQTAMDCKVSVKPLRQAGGGGFQVSGV